MLRASLTVVLIAILGLPRGICMCHFAEAAAPNESACCETQTPAHHDDDHDDCSCQLSEVLAASPAPLSVERDGAVNGAASVAGLHFAESAAPVLAQDNHFPAFDGPVPRILCALRI